MTKKKFKVDVTRIDTYEIEIDESVWNEDVLKDFSKTFYDVKDVKKLAENLALNISINGSSNEHFEGFGFVQMLSADGTKRTVWDGLKVLGEDDITKGIEVKVISEGDDIDTDVYLIE